MVEDAESFVQGHFLSWLDVALGNLGCQTTDIRMRKSDFQFIILSFFKIANLDIHDNLSVKLHVKCELRDKIDIQFSRYILSKN